MDWNVPCTGFAILYTPARLTDMSFLRTLFGTKKEDSKLSLLKDFSALRTDFHSHLIPGIDDGAASEEDSIQMLNGLADLGFQKVITTPHVMSDSYRNSQETILAGRDKIRPLAPQQEMRLETEHCATGMFSLKFPTSTPRKISSASCLTSRCKGTSRCWPTLNDTLSGTASLKCTRN